MARKAQKMQDSSSDDDAPEVVPHSASKADAKRSQKALHDFEAEEKARRKARNRERDQKLKERAQATKGGKTGVKLKGVKFVDQELEGEEGGSGEGEDHEDDGVEARMLRAMKDAADEVESDEGEDDDDDDDEFGGFGQGMDSDDGTVSGSDSSFAQEDEDDAEMSLGESDPIGPEAPMDDEEMDEDEETTPPQANVHKSSRKADYLADDLFAAAFASQDSKSLPKKNIESTQQQTIRKRRRKSIARPKDLVIGYVMLSHEVQFVRHSFRIQRSYHPHIAPIF